MMQIGYGGGGILEAGESGWEAEDSFARGVVDDATVVAGDVADEDEAMMCIWR
jgi:hypothetical protein